MEVVSGIAGVSQLVTYSHSAIRQLTKLYDATKEDAGFYRVQRYNLTFLLQAIQHISLDHSRDTERLLPLLIEIADLTTSLIKLLKPQGSLARSLHWFVKSQEIESTFNTLNEKTRLLQLHLSERTYSIVAHIHRDIKDMGKTKQEVCPNFC